MAHAVLQLVRNREDWPLRFCQVLSLFALQGIVVLAAYALMGPDTTQSDLPVGLQLDQRHGVLHLLIGLAAAGVAFLRPADALRLVAGFAILYLALAFFGTFTDIHFGMELHVPENALHWFLGALAAIVAYLTPRGGPEHGSSPQGA